MKKTIIYIVTIILSMFVGCAGMYGLFYYYPNVVIDTKSEKTVTVDEKGIAEGVSNVINSVIVIESYKRNTLSSIGSGFIYKIENKKAYIMTNHHVIDGSDKIIVTLADNEEKTATLVGSDEYSDIAVLTIESNENLKASTIGSAEKSNVGDTVFTIGAPMGKEYAGTVTRGILSGKNRMISTSTSNSTSRIDTITNVMQTDAAINPGNSGGPLCNVSGEVIGITSMKIVESSVEGLGFAIPIEDAISYAKILEEDGKITRPYMGISMYDASEKFILARQGINIDSSVDSGVVVTNVVSSSPAEKSGLKINDVIFKIGDKEVENVAELRYYLYQYNPGDKVKMSVFRNKEVKELTITLGKSE